MRATLPNLSTVIHLQIHRNLWYRTPTAPVEILQERWFHLQCLVDVPQREFVLRQMDERLRAIS